MNTYKKYAPNVFVAKCADKHEKGETIIVTTKYGKENECIVFNLVGRTTDGYYCYSIVRADGFNVQEWAKRKAEKYDEYALSAENKSDHYYKRSNKDHGFLSLGEPIKVGHHSEKRHRKIIQEAWDNMGRSVAYSDKAKEHEAKAEYWNSRANDINLSMPESLEFYEYKLEVAKEYHEGLKSGKYERSHAYSLTYAKKNVNELTKKFNLAKKLWE